MADKLGAIDESSQWMNKKAALQAECVFECLYPGRNACTRKLKCDIFLPPEDSFFESFRSCAQEKKLFTKSGQIFACVSKLMVTSEGEINRPEMTTRYDYALLEFTANLAEAEATYGEKLQSVIDTFSQSRLDLPLKRLSEISKIHGRAAQNLRKFMDPKKNEHLNLWKLCNIYSCCAVDLDKAMRETRSSLRAKMTVEGAVAVKPKRRNIFNSILNSNSTLASRNESTVAAEGSQEKERKWFPKLYDRKADLRTSRKITTSSLEQNEKEEKEMTGSKSTPPTPPVIRAHAPLTTSASVAPETLSKPPRPPRATIIIPPDVPSTVLPPLPATSPPQMYATPVYADLQKASLNNNNRVGGIVEEHSLRHSDDAPPKSSVVRIRTDVEVNVNGESRRNETNVSAYGSPYLNKSHYVNIRPPIAQKPKIIPPDRSPRFESDVAPTFISVDCLPSSAPVPSPRTYFNSSDIPSSQRSSSSAYSSNFSSTSSSSNVNVTSFAVADNSLSSEIIENARIVRVASPDGLLHRF
ncbi:unnamed protein product [Caenorhabditis sp. 36 PRJEB53466]|nr:unnamed protein product [Caenorhabditis sp. 36 PRJEB53466]